MRYITVLFMLVLSFNAMAQQDSLVSFFSENWKKTEDGPDAFYYRKTVLKDGLWYARDYYKKNGVLRNTGTYKLQDSIRHGDFVYYYDNGQKEQEGKYINDEVEGEWKGWHENGRQWYRAHYKEGYKVNQYTSWYEDGAKRSELNYLDDIAACRAEEKTDSIGKKIRIEGKYEGTCLYYYPNGKLASKEEWKDKPLKVEYWDSKGSPMIPEKDSLGEYVFQVMPRFEGEIAQFIGKEVKYPKASRSRGEQGRPVVKFIVGKNGEVTDVTLLHTSGFTLIDEEAMRVVRQMSGRWTPGRVHNLQVKVYYTLPVRFKLQE